MMQVGLVSMLRGAAGKAAVLLTTVAEQIAAKLLQCSVATQGWVVLVMHGEQPRHGNTVVCMFVHGVMAQGSCSVWTQGLVMSALLLRHLHLGMCLLCRYGLLGWGHKPATSCLAVVAAVLLLLLC